MWSLALSPKKLLAPDIMPKLHIIGGSVPLEHKLNVVFMALTAHNVVDDVVIRSNEVADKTVNVLQQHGRLQMLHVFGRHNLEPLPDLKSNLSTKYKRPCSKSVENTTNVQCSVTLSLSTRSWHLTQHVTTCKVDIKFSTNLVSRIENERIKLALNLRHHVMAQVVVLYLFAG